MAQFREAPIALVSSIVQLDDFHITLEVIRSREACVKFLVSTVKANGFTRALLSSFSHFPLIHFSLRRIFDLTPLI